MKNVWKKVVSLLLCGLMLFSVLPASALPVAVNTYDAAEQDTANTAKLSTEATKQVLTVNGQTYPFTSTSSTQVLNIHTTYGSTRATMPYLVFEISETDWADFDINMQMYDGQSPMHNAWTNCIFQNSSDETVVTKISLGSYHYYCFDMSKITTARDGTALRDTEKYVSLLMQANFASRTVNNIYLTDSIDELTAEPEVPEEPAVEVTKQSLTVSGQTYPFTSTTSTQINNIHTSYGFTRATMPYLVFQISETDWADFDINLQLYDGQSPMHNAWTNCLFKNSSDETVVTKIALGSYHYYCFDLSKVTTARDDTALRDTEKYVTLLMQANFAGRTVNDIYFADSIADLTSTSTEPEEPEEPVVDFDKQPLTVSGQTYPFTSTNSTQVNSIHTIYGSTRVDHPYLIIGVTESDWTDFDINMQMYDGQSPMHNAWTNCIFQNTSNVAIVSKIEKDGIHYYCFDMSKITTARDGTALRDTEKYVTLLMQANFAGRTVNEIYLADTITHLQSTPTIAKQTLTVSGKEYPFVTTDSTQIGNIHSNYGFTRADMPYLVFNITEDSWADFDINMQMYDGQSPMHNAWTNCIFENTASTTVVSKYELDGSHYYCFDMSKILLARDMTSLRDTEKYVTLLMQANFAGRTLNEIYFADSIEDIASLGTVPSEEEESILKSFTLEASSEQITVDGGEILLTPHVEYQDGSTSILDVHYTTDTINASITRNEDGTATLKGMMNGTITVSAVIAGAKETADITITITGQSEKMAANSFKILALGNSILRHGYNESIGWVWSDRGMAATAPENDYIHRLVYYMDQKYGEGSTEFVISGISGFEGQIQKDDAAYDYTENIKSFVTTAATEQPDIITVQIGENVGETTQESYTHAVISLISALKEAAPNAVVIVTTPFWGSDESIKVLGAIDAAEQLGIQYAACHTLNSRENMAYGQFDDLELYPSRVNMTGGVLNHPGDKGMDEMAKLMFRAVNTELTEKYTVEYTVFPESVEFLSEITEITEELGTLQLSARVLPVEASQSLVWSSFDDYTATVDSNGLVSALNNGTVTIRAASRYDSSVYADIDITISGQTDPFTVTYDANTTDTVTDLPEPNTLAKYDFALDNVFPSRKYYNFLGFSLTPDGEVVDSVYVDRDMTVYAQWEIADTWDFERDGYLQNIQVENGFNVYVLDGKFQTIATDVNIDEGEGLLINSPELNLDSSNYNLFTLTMKNSAFAEDTEIQVAIYTTEGGTFYSQKVVSDDYYTYTFALDELGGTITGFSILPTNIDCSIFIEYIGFEMTDKEIYKVSFAGDDVVSLPSPITVVEGNTLSLAVITKALEATTEGMNIYGWSVDGQDAYFGTDNFVDLEITPTSDVTLTAMVGYDINFALSSPSVSGSHGTYTIEDGYLKWVTKECSGHTCQYGPDIQLFFNDLSVPLDKYIGIEMILDVDYSSPKAELKIDTSFSGDGIYFRRGDDGVYGSDRRLTSPDVELFEAYGEEYAILNYAGYTSDKWNETLTNVRYDFREGHYDFNLRYVRFTPIVPFEEKNIAIDNVVVPEAGILIGEDVTDTNDMLNVESVTWSVGGYAETGRFKENTVYTLTVVAYPKQFTGKCFASDSTATINGNAAEIQIDEDGIATISYTFEQTQNYKPFTFTISGADSISDAGRWTEYKASFDGDIPDKTFTLVSSDDSVVKIDQETGYVYPLTNGVVELYAYSNYNPSVNSDNTITLTVTNQYDPVIVKYHSGAPEGTVVSGMPSDDMSAAGYAYKLSDAVPTRSGFLFEGWAVGEESLSIVDTIRAIPQTATSTELVADGDGFKEVSVIDVYARWIKGEFFEFNDRSDVDSGRFSTQSCSTIVVENGYVAFNSTSTDPINRLTLSNTNGNDCTSIQIRIASDVSATQLGELYYTAKANRGDSDYVIPPYHVNATLYAGTLTRPTSSYSLGDIDEFKIIEFQPTNSSWKNEIVEVRFDPINTSGNVRIDYIRFVQYDRNVTFVAGGNDVMGMPGDLKAELGSTITLSGVPVREGYAFGGWSKTSDDIDGKFSFVIVDDTELYAIWNELIDTENAICISAEDEAILVKLDGNKESVTFTYNGGADTITAKANSKGYAVIDLTGIQDEITDGVLTCDVAIEQASVTTLAFAKEMYNASVVKAEVTVKISKNESDEQIIYANGGYKSSVEYPNLQKDIDSLATESVTVEEPVDYFPITVEEAMPFIDVLTTNWFYKEVENAYKRGLVKGVTEDTYVPYGNVTVAEAITLASRINAVYNGNEIPGNSDGEKWYSDNVNYAILNGIITEDQFDSYDATALRREVAAIFAKTLDESQYEAINAFTEINDVDASDEDFEAILKLYNAGIVIGSDEEYNFNSDTNITRAEIAAIINRITNEKSRKRVVTANEIEANRTVFLAKDLYENTAARNCTSATLSLVKDVVGATATTTDPNVNLTKLLSIYEGKSINKITILIKGDKDLDPVIYYATKTTGWSLSNKITGKIGETNDRGFTEVVFNVKDGISLFDELMAARFDPFTAKGSFTIFSLTIE